MTIELLRRLIQDSLDTAQNLGRLEGREEAFGVFSISREDRKELVADLSFSMELIGWSLDALAEDIQPFSNWVPLVEGFNLAAPESAVVVALDHPTGVVAWQDIRALSFWVPATEEAEKRGLELVCQQDCGCEGC